MADFSIVHAHAAQHPPRSEDVKGQSQAWTQAHHLHDDIGAPPVSDSPDLSVHAFAVRLEIERLRTQRASTF